MSERHNPIWYGPGEYGIGCDCGSADEHARRCLDAAVQPAADDDKSPDGAE